MERLPQRDDIQGLRALAVLAVVVFHLNRDWMPGGFIGVDVFLVISGFLITSIIVRQRCEGSFSFVSFYVSRVRRIVPAYLMLLAAVGVCMAVLLTPQDYASFERSLRAALYFNANGFFASQSDYFAPAAHELPLLHTWSLAVEMQFYLVLPALLFLIPRRLVAPGLAAVAVLLLAWSSYRLAQGQRQAEYFSLMARIPEFLMGGMLAVRPIGRDWTGRRSNLAAGIGLLLIVAGCWFISEEAPFPGLLALVPCLGAVLIIAAGSRSVVNRGLSRPALVWIGALSYSLYLWHWPILAGLRYFFETYHLPFTAAVAFAALTLALSYASHRYIELPFRRGKTYLRPVALAAGVLASLGAAHLINPRLVDVLPQAMTRYAPDSEICHGNIVGDCIRGDRSADHEILMLGDSHGAQLNYFADVVGQALRTRIRVITASSCLPITGFDVERPVEWARAPCLEQIERAGTYVPLAEGLVVAGMWQYHFKSERFLDAVDRFIGDAATRNQRVIVLAQVPMLTSNVLRRFRFEQLGLPHSRVEMNPEWKEANETISKLVALHLNATFLDLTRDPLFADAPFENGVLLYSDSHHLNEIGSRRYGQVALPYFEQWAGGMFRSGPPAHYSPSGVSLRQ